MQQLRTLKSWYGRNFTNWDGLAGLDQDLVHMDNHLPNITFAGAVAAGTAASAVAGTVPGIAQLFEDGTYAITSKNAAGNLVATAYAAKQGSLACDGAAIYISTGTGWVNYFLGLGKTKNAELLAAAMLKIRAGTAKGVCQGDSLTYGYDEVSAGTIAPVAPHTRYHVPVPYPEKLQIELNRIYSSTGITVINQGFSGDTALTSFNRWTVDTGADIAFVMLGTNDAKVTGLSLSAYLTYMQAIIARFNAWGTGVVLVTSPSLEQGTSTTTLESYRAAILSLDCPVFRADEITLNNSFAELYSDVTHFNQVGYTLIANTLAAWIASGGLLGHANKVTAEATLLYGNEHHVATNVANYINGASASVTQGLTLGLAAGAAAKATLAFYLDADAAYISVIGRLSVGQVVTIDSDSIRGNVTREGIVARTTDNYTINKNLILAEPTNDLFLGQIIGRGWHSVTISAPSGASTTTGYLHALRITPRSQEECSTSVYNITRRSFSKFDPIAPAAVTPGGSVIAAFTFEGALFASLFTNTSAYYASATIDLCITNMVVGVCSYTNYKIRVTANGVLTATLISSVGANPITVTSITVTSTLNSPGSVVTLNVNRPTAGYAEFRFDVPDIPQLLNVALM